MVVQVNQGSVNRTSSGTAWHCEWVRWSGNRKKTTRKISTDGGAFKISLSIIPKKYLGLGFDSYDGLKAAENFMHVARHEWGHIRDYQNGGWYRLEWSRRGPGGRRGLHDRRPEEIRTENYIYESDKARRNRNWAYAEIMDLALFLEARKSVKNLD